MYVSDVEEDEEEEEEEDEEEEEEEEEEYIPSIDLYRERSLYEILQRELAFKIPTWVPLAGFTAILSYLWIVGFVSGRC